MVKAHPPPSELQALFVQPRRPSVFACFARHAPETSECARDAPRVLLATRQSQALFKQHSRASEVSLPAHRVRQGAEAPGDAERSTKLAGQCEGLFVQARRAFIVSLLVGHKPKLAQRSPHAFFMA